MTRKVIIGLGNPELSFCKTMQNDDCTLLQSLEAQGLLTETATTRHNIGFNVLNTLAGSQVFQHDTALKASIVALDIQGIPVVLVQPMTGMNTSGLAVEAVLRHYGLSAADILVVYDDIALPLGQIRFRPSGSAGGHNGIKSIIEHLGGNSQFDRLKVAVGPVPPGTSIINFVLSSVGPEAKSSCDLMIAKAAEAAQVWVHKGINHAMSYYNNRSFNKDAK